MATPRSQQLAKLGAALPGRNRQQQAAGRGAADMAIKQAAAQMSPAAVGTGQTQAMAAQAVKAQAQPGLQAAQQNVQQQGEIAKRQLQEKQATEQRKQMQRRLGSMQRDREFKDLIAKVDNNAKNKLIDAEMQFQQDRFGRTKFTERQLMDFAILQAKDENELQKYADNVRRATENEIYMIKHATRMLEQELKNQLELDHTKRDNAYIAELAKRKHNLEMKMRKKQADKANRASMISTVAAVGVTAAAVYFTGGAAAAYAPAIFAATQGATQAGISASDG